MKNENENENNQSIYFIVNKAKGMLVDAVGQVMDRTGLPPYIIDGILSGILSDIRQKEIYDMGVLMTIHEQKRDEEQASNCIKDGNDGRRENSNARTDTDC